MLVVLIFSSRLPYVRFTSSLFNSLNMLIIPSVAILAILYLHYITTFHDNPNVGVAITVAMVFQQCELGYSLVSSTIPILKTFLRDFDTGMGLNLSSVMATTGYGSSNNRGGNYKLKELSKDGTQPSQTSRTERSRRTGLQKLRPDLHEYTTSIYHSTRPESTSEDISHATAGSQEMIIHKGVEFEVRRD